MDFTNPVGIVTQALLDEGHRAVGLCNVAIFVQRRIGHYLGVEPDDVELEHVGLNHLTWARSATVDGVDRLPELLERFAPELELESGVPAGLLGLLGALPSYYLHYYYCLDENLREQAVPGWRSRAEVVAELESELLAEYRDAALDTKPEKLSWRGGAFYSEAAVRLVASLHAGTGDVQVVDVRNQGALPGIADDAVVEMPCTVDKDGAHPLPQRALPPEMAGLVSHCKAYERLAVEAAGSGSRETMIRALVANPLVGQYPLARAARRSAARGEPPLPPAVLPRRLSLLVEGRGSSPRAGVPRRGPGFLAEGRFAPPRGAPTSGAASSGRIREGKDEGPYPGTHDGATTARWGTDRSTPTDHRTGTGGCAPPHPPRSGARGTRHRNRVRPPPCQGLCGVRR